MKTLQLKRYSGFTLMELMISVAIIAIIAAIAIPSYMDYSKRAKWAELVKAAAPYQMAVAECMADNNGAATTCDAGAGNIPADLAAVAGTNIESITTADGVVTVTAKAALGGDDLILTPTMASGLVTWAKTGDAITNKLVK